MDYLFPSKFDTDFRDKTTVEARKKEAARLTSLYPKRTLVIVESERVLKLDKKKYLVPGDLTVGEFLIVIRKRMSNLAPGDALFFFLENNTLPTVSETIASVHSNLKNEDGFLYFKLTTENAFGKRSC